MPETINQIDTTVCEPLHVPIQLTIQLTIRIPEETNLPSMVPYAPRSSDFTGFDWDVLVY